MMHFAIDRFEGEYAVLENIENGSMSNVLKSTLPSSSKEGDIILYDGINYIIDDTARKKREEDIMNKFQRLKNNT